MEGLVCGRRSKEKADCSAPVGKAAVAAICDSAGVRRAGRWFRRKELRLSCGSCCWSWVSREREERWLLWEGGGPAEREKENQRGGERYVRAVRGRTAASVLFVCCQGRGQRLQQMRGKGGEGNGVERAAESAGSVFGEGKWRWVKAGAGAEWLLWFGFKERGSSGEGKEMVSV